MGDALQILAGTILLALAFFDFVKTAIGTAGMGPVSRRVAAAQWRLARGLVPTMKRRIDRPFERAVGPAVLCAIAAVWILLSWGAYSLLFSAVGALAPVDDDLVTVTETIAFAGASLSTLGAALSRAGSGWWDMLSAVAAINGMIVLTLSVSFMMNVWQAMQKARALALRIAALDAAAPALDDRDLVAALGALGPALVDLVVAVRGVPVVAYFSTEHPRMSLPEAIVILCRLITRVGNVPATQGLSELWTALGTLAEEQDGPGALDDPIPAVCRWAEEHRLPA